MDDNEFKSRYGLPLFIIAIVIMYLFVIYAILILFGWWF